MLMVVINLVALLAMVTKTMMTVQATISPTTSDYDDAAIYL